jgi:hypothetical protein
VRFRHAAVLCAFQLAGWCAAVPALKPGSGYGLPGAHIPGLGQVFFQMFNIDHFLSILPFENYDWLTIA